MRTRIDKSELPFSDRYIVMLMLPMIGETFLNVAIGIADTIMVSSAGEASISGVSVVDSLLFLFTLVFQCFAGGGAVVYSQYLGAKDDEHADKAARVLMQLVFLTGLLCAVVIFIFRRQFLHMLMGSAEEAVMKAASDYIIPMSLSMPFLGLLSGGSALVRSMGKSKVAMNTALVMNVINIAGNAILIYVFKMGALGAGIASMFARIIATISILYILAHGKDMRHVKGLFSFHFEKRIVSNMLRVAIPNTVENCVFHFGKLLLISLVATLGTTAMAANAAANNLGSLIALPGCAMNMAIIPIVSHCCGAGRYDHAEYYAKKIILWEHIAFLVTNLPFFLFVRQIFSIYNLGPDAMELAIRVFLIMLVHVAFFWPLSFAISPSLAASGDVMFPMIVSITSMWIFRVGGGYLLGLVFGMGLEGVFWAMFIDWYVRIIVFSARFLSGKWKGKKVI